jgi:hypothetical protein
MAAAGGRHRQGAPAERGEGPVRARIKRGSGGGAVRASNRAGTHRRRRIAAAGGAEGRGGDGARVRPGKRNGAFEWEGEEEVSRRLRD